jgi:hypothetical protein
MTLDGAMHGRTMITDQIQRDSMVVSMITDEIQ